MNLRYWYIGSPHPAKPHDPIRHPNLGKNVASSARYNSNYRIVVKLQHLILCPVYIYSKPVNVS